MKNLALIALTLTCLACETTVQTEPKTIQHVPSQEHLSAATLYTQSAAEYQALCYQAYNLATEKLITKLNSGVSKPAVVLDIDETILDNSPYTANQILNDEAYSKESWKAWVELAQAKPIPGVTHFLNTADSLGVTLFFVSNRDTSAIMPTIKNMKALGMPQAEQAHYYLKSTTSDKTERRNAILAQGYNIILFIGDNLGDYKGDWDKPASTEERAKLVQTHQSDFGNTFIALPNAMYGTWQGALYDYDRSLSDSAKRVKRMKSLQGFKAQ